VGIELRGPLRVNGAGSSLRPRDRVLLSALAVRPGEVVAPDRLADALWGEEPPPSWPKQVQICVMRLRKELGSSMIETAGGGYRLTAAADDLDVARFEGLVERGRLLAASGEPERAASTLARALGLWRGRRSRTWTGGRRGATRRPGSPSCGAPPRRSCSMLCWRPVNTGTWPPNRLGGGNPAPGPVAGGRTRPSGAVSRVPRQGPGRLRRRRHRMVLRPRRRRGRLPGQAAGARLVGGGGSLGLRQVVTGAGRAGAVQITATAGHLVTVTSEGQVLELAPDTLEPVGTPFPGINGLATEVALSDDGRRLLVLGFDRTLHLYDVETRTQLGDAIPVGVSFAGAALRGDGLEATVATDQGIAAWDLDPDHWVDGAGQIAGRNLTRAEWDQYIGRLEAYRRTCSAFPGG
jgi:DNA-binding winged helix-turn-helix (wHTH) protein